MQEQSSCGGKTSYKLYAWVGVVYAPDGVMEPKYLRLSPTGEKYYRPILDMRYDGHDGDLWMVIEKRINIEHSQTAERHKEAVLAVGLAFFTEVYEFCVRRLLMEEDKEERTALKKHRVKKIKGIKVVTKVQGRPDRAIMPRPAVFTMKTKNDRGREKRQAGRRLMNSTDGFDDGFQEGELCRYGTPGTGAQG